MPVEDRPPEDEGKFHHYLGSTIPWFVHVGWVLFWIFAITYTLTYLLPALKLELVSPP